MCRVQEQDEIFAIRIEEKSLSNYNSEPYLGTIGNKFLQNLEPLSNPFPSILQQYKHIYSLNINANKLQIS